MGECNRYCYHECYIRRGKDAALVVGASSDKPDDHTRGILNDPLATAVDDGALDVGEIVADKFAALHAEGGEAVALLGKAQCEGEGDLAAVEGGAV